MQPSKHITIDGHIRKPSCFDMAAMPAAHDGRLG